MNLGPGGGDVGAVNDAGIGFILDDFRQHGADITFEAGRRDGQCVRSKQPLRCGAAGNRDVAQDEGDVGICDIVEAGDLGGVMRRDGDGQRVRCEQFWLLDGVGLDCAIHGFW